jgi:hypothetical protein
LGAQFAEEKQGCGVTSVTYRAGSLLNDNSGGGIRMATTTSVFLPDEQEQQVSKKPAQSTRSDGRGRANNAPTVGGDDAEIRKLNEEELKAAILSAWKKLERIGKKEMGGLLYWLREKLRAQGSRNDIRDQDKGFGAWVEKTIEISRRTADRWADDYAYTYGLKVRKTSGQGFEARLRHDVLSW